MPPDHRDGVSLDPVEIVRLYGKRMQSAVAKMLAVIPLAAMAALGGCASSAPPAPAVQPVARPADHTRRLAIVGSGDARFAVVEQKVEPGRTLEEVAKWHPYGAIFKPFVGMVHRAINRFLEGDRAAGVEPRVPVSPSSMVAEMSCIGGCLLCRPIAWV